jgi:hypothetical protein
MSSLLPLKSKPSLGEKLWCYQWSRVKVEQACQRARLAAVSFYEGEVKNIDVSEAIGVHPRCMAMCAVGSKAVCVCEDRLLVLDVDTETVKVVDFSTIAKCACTGRRTCAGACFTKFYSICAVGNTAALAPWDSSTLLVFLMHAPTRSEELTSPVLSLCATMRLTAFAL